MLGKRPRPPMNRSRSMSQLNGPRNFALESAQEKPGSQRGHIDDSTEPGAYSPRSKGEGGYYYYCSSIEPAHFLEACHLCNCRLGDGRDIYMYRGDSAFCSDECRQQQISIDERKEKSSANVTGMKKGQMAASSSTSNNNKGNFQAQAETVAAA